MSNNYKGTLDITGEILVQNKMVGLNIELDGKVDTYIADESGHIDLPITNINDIDKTFSQFPISQYGTLNKDVGIAGTYDGGSTVPYYSSMPVLLENDGTLVYLRPGTNGTTINYYYTYVNNPNSSTITPQSTIRKYYNGSSKNIVFYDSYTKDTLLYQEIDNNIVHVVLTNGTLDNNYHQEATFSKTLTPYPIISGLKVDNYIYIICLYTSPTPSSPIGINIYQPYSNPLEFIFYRISVSDIISGTISTVEQVSGISGQTMYGDTVSSSNSIKLADSWASSSSNTDKSFIKCSDALLSNLNIYTYSIIGVGKSYYDGTNIIFSFYTNAFNLNSTQRSDTFYGFSITYNVSAKTYSSDLSSTPITCTGSSSGVITWSNPYSINSSKIDGVGNSNTDGNSCSWYITDNGIQYSVREKYILDDVYRIARCNISGFSTKADAYKIRNRILIDTVYNEISGDYASRVGDQLCGGSPISPTKILFTGTGTYDGTNYSKYYRGISDIGSTRTYSYESLNNGTITGYSPQAYRVNFGNESEMLSKISLHDSSTGIVNSYGTAFIEGYKNTAGYHFDSTSLVYDTMYSCSDSVLQSVKNQILSNLGLSPSSSRIGIYYISDNTYCKSIACITTVNVGNTGGNIIAATIDCTLSGTVITNITLNTVFYNNVRTDIRVLSSNILEVYPKSGLSCVKYGDFTYISFSHLIHFGVPADFYELSMCGVVNSNTVTSVISTRSYHASGISSDTREYSYLPNYGFGYYSYASDTDNGTKLIFYYAGNNLSNFNTLYSGTTPSTKIVVLAQDVIVGFYLYFTEITPVFIGGQYYELPITTIDLSTIKENPSNTLFYAYVQYNAGIASYVISTTVIDETINNMFIGTLETDTTKVSSLNINNVSKFNNYRPSTTNIGSAFPVSTGFPSSTGTINW